MEKYYTPDISEFHVGFECEKWIESHPEGFWSEVSEKLSKDELSDLLLATEEQIQQKYRVKYLDREDVESLGWKQNKYNYNIGDWCLSGQIEYQNIEIDKEFVDYPDGAYTNWTEKYFNGKIKNKSELKKLMQQLQIL